MSAAPIFKARLPAIDWTKGALVLIMVVYHCLNRSLYHPYAFRFMAFLPPSFILIAGFLLTRHSREKTPEQQRGAYAKTFLRGLKLLILFTVLNVVFYALFTPGGPATGVELFFEKANEIYLHAKVRAARFEVLVSISYFLMVAPLFLRLRAWKDWLIPAAAAILFALCVLLERRGGAIDTLGLITAGVIGMAFGLVPQQKIDQAARHGPGLILAYVLYRGLSFRFGEIYAVQMVGVCVTVLILYALALKCGAAGWGNQQIIMLGKHSLLAYIGQIALLQFFLKVWRENPMHREGLLAALPLVAVATWLLVKAFDLAQPRFAKRRPA